MCVICVAPRLTESVRALLQAIDGEFVLCAPKQTHSLSLFDCLFDSMTTASQFYESNLSWLVSDSSVLEDVDFSIRVSPLGRKIADCSGANKEIELT
jgi:hypothetical protein